MRLLSVFHSLVLPEIPFGKGILPLVVRDECSFPTAIKHWRKPLNPVSMKVIEQGMQ